MTTSNLAPKRIFVAPLNWGLGHTTRCIPIIKELVAQGAKVWLGSDGRAARLLAAEFPNLPLIELPSYQISYPYQNMLLNMALQSPRFFSAIKKENQAIQHLQKQHQFDCIISDNRFGCYHPKVNSIFITHQANILAQPRIAQKAASWVNQQLIRRFNKVWIPDFENEPGLAGPMSHGQFSFAHKHIGILTRMHKKESVQKYDLAVVLSGPEPQRSIFEELILSQAVELEYRVLVVKGKTEREEHYFINDRIEVINSLSGEALNEKMLLAKTIMSRSGYSTIMDLVALQKPAILVPTPGQYEQEYLAKRLMKENIFYTCFQDQLDLKQCLQAVKQYPGFTTSDQDLNLYKDAVSGLLAT